MTARRCAPSRGAPPEVNLAAWARRAVIVFAPLGPFALAACTSGPRSVDATVAAHDVAVAERDSVVLDTVASGLQVPWALAFAPDGRVFVTERAGRVRVIEHDSLRAEPWATLDVAAVGEAGLMGIAVAPDFASSRAVYVVGTFRLGDDLVDRVVRLTDRGGRGVDPRVVVDSIPAAQFHAGDAVAFGPDGMLYVATGDGREPSRAHDPHSRAGKILRFTPDGRVPPDNPTSGSPVWASGMRNPQGLAWDRGTGQLFATDHGPSGFPNERFRTNDDELNAVRRGGDHGWPAHAGMSDDARYVPPIVAWNPGIAPSGLARYDGADFPAWRGSLFVGALRGTQLRRIELAPDARARSGWRVVRQVPMFAELGRIRAVAAAPDGRLWFTTSNRDGRGSPRPGDDHVYRLRARR